MPADAIPWPLCVLLGTTGARGAFASTAVRAVSGGGAGVDIGAYAAPARLNSCVVTALRLVPFDPLTAVSYSSIAAAATAGAYGPLEGYALVGSSDGVVTAAGDHAPSVRLCGCCARMASRN